MSVGIVENHFYFQLLFYFLNIFLGVCIVLVIKMLMNSSFIFLFLVVVFYT